MIRKGSIAEKTIFAFMNSKPVVYFLSGLGANARTFSLLDLSWCEPVFVPWIPVEKGDTLERYALRMFDTGIRDEQACIAGLSFGGMLCTEIAKAHPGIRCCLISSNKCSREFPWWLKTGRVLPLYRRNRRPAGKDPFSKAGLRWFLGPATGDIEKLLLSIAVQTDPSLTIQFIDLIMGWKNKKVPDNIFHIHGQSDRLLPAYLIKNADVLIKGGTHLSVMNNASQISYWLKHYFVPET